MKSRPHRNRNASLSFLVEVVSVDLVYLFNTLLSKHFIFFCLTSLFWFPIEKKNAKKRLSQESFKQNTGLHPGFTDTSHPEEEEGLSTDPNVPVIEPKMEPQEQESM